MYITFLSFSSPARMKPRTTAPYTHKRKMPVMKREEKVSFYIKLTKEVRR
jgi:hypothetical protein